MEDVIIMINQIKIVKIQQTNDIIIVEVKIEKKYVKWTKQFTNESFTLAIDTSKDLYPCVLSLGQSRDIELSDQMKIF